MIWSRRTTWSCLVAVVVCCTLVTGVGWAYWTAGSAAGGNGASAATTVNQGATPTATALRRTVTVSWSASTLANGNAVAGYIVKRYDASTLTLQTTLSGCAGTVTATTCTETGVAPGEWVYSVTPVFATNWRGAESLKSRAVSVTAATLTLSSTRVRPATTVTGTAAGFAGGETLRYRLDSATGTELTGSLAGSPTPATVPAGGGGSVVITVPSGTSDGAHSVYAVASPSADMAVADVVVDGTAPPAPVLTVTPTAVSGSAVTFGYTEAEASASVECNLDGAAYVSCDNPKTYDELSVGAHTFQARATDTVGNVSTVTSYTWIVNLTVPTVAIAFPTIAGLYNDNGFNAGCGTASTGDVCGAADDDTAVTSVGVSLRRLSTGMYWNGTSFSAVLETFVNATGTSDWTYAISAAALPEGDYTLRAKATDAAANSGYDSRTFTIDRTAPAAPTLTSAPPATSGPSATLAFTTSDSTAGFECRLDSGAWASCSSPRTYSNLAHGAHTAEVRAVDGAGNTSTTTSATWTVDATAPTAALTFPSGTRYNLAGWSAGCGTPATGDVCGTAGDVGSGLASVAVSIRQSSTSNYWNGSSFGAASETWLTASGSGSWSYVFAGASFPADGGYTVRVRATDAVGNMTTAAVDLTLDTAAPPVPQIVQAPSDPSGSAAQFDFTDAETGAGFECRLDAGAWATCVPPLGYSGLAAGSHTFSVRAIDSAGNLSASTSYTWSVDTSLPNVSFDFPLGNGTYNDTTYAAGCGTPAGDLCGKASDPGGSVASVAVSIRRTGTGLYWNGSSFASATEVFVPATGTTSWSYPMAATSFPAEDSYVLRARSTDNVGLTAVDTLPITVDRTAPAAPTITSGPTGTTGGNDTFAFAAEAGAVFECRLDAGAWATCTSPKAYSALSDGSHTFDVRATDRAGNVSTATSRSWTVDATAPTIGTTFPIAGSRYNDATYNAGCGTASTGDICGTAADARSGVAKVEISVRRASTGLYLTGTTFSSSSQNWITVTGTASWSYALAAATFPADDTYTVVVRATDNADNAGTASTGFVIDRTKPTAVGFTTSNVATARKLESGDTFTLTYSEAMSPSSIVSGWTGATSQNVVVRATGSGGSKDKLSVYDATNTTLLPLGSLNLNRKDYVSGPLTFGATGTASTITMSGSSFTVRLGTASGTTGTAGAAANVIWTPAVGATDLAGNGAATTLFTESDLDNDF